MKKFSTLLLLASMLMAVGCSSGTPSATTANTAADDAESATVTAVPTDAVTEAETEAEEDTENYSAPVLYQIAPDKNMLLNSYVIKTRTGKLIVIDGGGAGSDANNGYLFRQLKKICDGGRLEIEAWFLSHLHDDHVNEFTLIGKDDQMPVRVNNIYLNVPSKEFMQKVENGKFAYLYDDVRTSYDRFIGEGEFDKINGKNVFQGDVIEIDGVKIEILLTMTENETESNLNDTSLIFRVTIEGQTVLFLNDAYIPEGNRLLALYGDELKSDIVQMAHHGQNGVTKKVYEAIAPTMCLWPTPIWVYDNANGIYQTTEVRQWMVDMGVKYHYIAGKDLTQSLTFPVDFSTLEENDITPK